MSLIFRRCSEGKPTKGTGSVECKAAMPHSYYSQNPSRQQENSDLEGRMPNYFARLGKEPKFSEKWDCSLYKEGETGWDRTAK